MTNKLSCSQTVMLSYLQKSDLLLYRLLSKECNQATKKIKGPYRTRIEFSLATGGLFCETKERKIFNATECTDAWATYSKVINYEEKTLSAPLKPAMLYKLRELTSINASGRITREMLAEFAAPEPCPKISGQQYEIITKHSWTINLIWVLAQIHIGRPFMLFSDLTQAHIMRSAPRENEFSAYAREIAALYKTKSYQFTTIDHHGHLLLRPTIDKTAAQALGYEDIYPEDKDIPSVINNLEHEKRNYLSCRRTK